MIDNLLKVEFTGRRFPQETDTSVRVSVSTSEGIPVSIQPPGFSETKEYDIYLKLGCSFTANSVEYDKRKEFATKHIKRELFKDVETKVREAMLSTSNVTTFNILNELLRDITK